MSKLVSVDFKFPNLAKRLIDSEARIEKFIIAQIQTNRAMLFSSEGAHNSHDKWEPLKFRHGQILALSGALKNSISPTGEKGKAGPKGFVSSTGTIKNKVTKVGTKIAYAHVHNEGMKISAKKSVMVFPGPMGKGKVFAKSVQIPRRNFTDWNETDQVELKESLTNLITKILEGR